jgi:hypothetical protein
MPRPLSRTQALQNRAFLKVLRKTGNVRLAAREVGLKYSTMQDRRRKHPHFASAWDAALVFAQARFERVGRGLSAKDGARDHAPSPRSRSRASRPSPAEGGGFRTAGGEAIIVRMKDGRLQMRRAEPGRLTREAEQGFLAALSATCNISLSAAAVGACHSAFDRRRRKDPAFAREMRLALQRGYEQLEMALLASGLPGSHEQDDWRSNDPPAIPPMTANQALQLMYLNQKAALMLDEPPHIRRRRGESAEAHSFRLGAMYAQRLQRDREAFEIAEAERMDRGEPAWGPAGEAVRRELALREGHGLPDLAQVTGWSKADPAKAPHHPERALFGGWRIEDMEQDAERSDADAKRRRSSA